MSEKIILSKKPYKGTRDFFPHDKRVLDYIFSKMKETAESFGYESYDGPLLEEVDLYRAKSGEEIVNEQIYSFHDRGERFVAIRPEMTPTVARMVAQAHKEISKPIRWYSIPNLYRYERPQKGRLREHWQYNVDIFGAPEIIGEVEVVNVVVNLLRSFGANEKMFQVLINDRGIVNFVFSDLMEADEQLTLRLYKIVDRSKKVSKEAIEEMLLEANVNEKQKLIFNKYLDINTFTQLANFLKEHNGGALAKRIETLRDYFKKLKLGPFVSYDPSIVRGLDYYTGIVFEVFDLNPENKRAISGGGAYANLLQIFNEDPLPGVGFGLGDVTLTDFLKVHKLLPESASKKVVDIYFTFQTSEATAIALGIANDIRDLGFKVETEPSPLKFKKLFKEAEKKGAKFVAFIDQKELDSKKFQLRNMSTKENHEIEFNKVNQLKKIIK